MPTEISKKCFFCEKEQDDDQFCHGCHAYICEECDHNPFLMGGHNPEDHEEYYDDRIEDDLGKD